MKTKKVDLILKLTELLKEAEKLREGVFSEFIKGKEYVHHQSYCFWIIRVHELFRSDEKSASIWRDKIAEYTEDEYSDNFNSLENVNKICEVMIRFSNIKLEKWK